MKKKWRLYKTEEYKNDLTTHFSFTFLSLSMASSLFSTTLCKCVPSGLSEKWNALWNNIVVCSSPMNVSHDSRLRRVARSQMPRRSHAAGKRSSLLTSGTYERNLGTLTITFLLTRFLSRKKKFHKVFLQRLCRQLRVFSATFDYETYTAQQKHAISVMKC